MVLAMALDKGPCGWLHHHGTKTKICLSGRIDVANFEDFRTLQEFAIEAKLRLSPAVWDFLSGGGESETTLRRNRYAIDSISFALASCSAGSALSGNPAHAPNCATGPIGKWPRSPFGWHGISP